jgi:hypothetical protein
MKFFNPWAQFYTIPSQKYFSQAKCRISSFDKEGQPGAGRGDYTARRMDSTGAAILYLQEKGYF